MKILINSVNITNRLLEYKTNAQMSNDSLIIGNTIAKQVTMKLDNQDGLINTLIDYPFIIYDKDDKVIGKFRVYEKPEKYTGELSLTLYDNVYLFSQRYDSAQEYPTTIEKQLDEMSTLTGVTINKSLLPTHILNKKVDWYDNTISMRNYLGWIAELDGCNVFANEKGEIIFRSLAVTTYQTVDIETYEKSDLVTFTRICFDDGILKLEKGDEKGNTLYLSSNNGYIDSSTSIDNIYNKYKNLTFYSVSKVKMANINGWYLTDLINYNEEFIFMPLSINETYAGGEYSIANVEGNINTKNNEMVVNKIDPSVKIRRLQITVDKNNQTLEILAQDLKDGLGQISDFKVELGKISTSVSNTEKKVETLKNNLEVTLSSNLPLNQVYETATELFIPDYTKQNLVITAVAKLLDYTLVTNSCSYVWKRKTAEGETDLIAGESANKNVLTVNKNVLSSNKSIDYICYATFNEQTVQSQVSLSLTVNGKDGVDGKPGTPGKDAILCKINATSTVFTLIKLEDGTITSNPNSINLTGDFQNCEYAGWYYSPDGINFEKVENIEGCSVQEETKVLTIESTSSLFSERTSVVFKLTSDVATAQDTVTIITTLDNTYIDNELGNIKDTVEKVTYTADTALSEINALNGTIIDTITNTTTTLINDSVTEINKQLIEFKETINGLDISKVIEKTDVLEGTLNAYSEYLHLGTDSIRLGKSNSSIQTVITNDKFAIQQNNVDIAYVSANKLFIESALILNDITVGNEKDGYYRWRLRTNGNYSLTYSKEV